MMTERVAEDLRSLFAQVMDLPASQVRPELTQDNCGTWTSLNHLMLVSQIEARFGVMFANQEITAMTSYGQISRTLAQHLTAE